MSALRFGPGGLEAWAGPQTNRSDDVSRLAAMSPVSQPKARILPSSTPAWRQGIPLLLWRCPICRIEGSLAQKGRLFSIQSLDCRACGSAWAVIRKPEKDFRLRVIRGPRSLIGLDLPLSGWYDEMKRGFVPSPLPRRGKESTPDEEAYLQTNRARLFLDRSISLDQDWAGREAPDRELPPRAGDWRRIGPGKVTLTNRRLIWESPEGSLDFWWPRVRTLHLRSYYLLGLGYGVTTYRFLFLRESALRWLTYASELVKNRKMASAEIPPVKISHY